MAIRKRKGRASPYQVYWNNPFTKTRESASFATLAEARKHDSLIKHRLEFERESFRPDDVEVAAAGSVRELIALYLAQSKIKGFNMETTLYHLKSVIAFFGRREVSSLSKKDLIAFTQDQVRLGVKALTAHRRLSILRAALAWATDTDFLDANPLAGVKVPKGRPERIAPPSYAELEKLIAVAPNHIQRAILLAVSLGVRVGESELLSLRWEDVDLSRQLIRVWSAAKNPNRPYRDVPIRADLLSALKAWAVEDAPLRPAVIVHYKGKPVKSIKTAWKTCKCNAGVSRRLRPYDLRHAFATFAMDAGADIKAIADTMGHSDASMVLKHYQHGQEASRRAAVEAIRGLPSYVPRQITAQNRSSQDCIADKEPEDSVPL